MTLRFYDSVKGMKKCKAEKYSHFFSFFPWKDKNKAEITHLNDFSSPQILQGEEIPSITHPTCFITIYIPLDSSHQTWWPPRRCPCTSHSGKPSCPLSAASHGFFLPGSAGWSWPPKWQSICWCSARGRRGRRARNKGWDYTREMLSIFYSH